MADFPLIRSASNRIARASQYTDDIEGYVFDGAVAGTRTMHLFGGRRAEREG
jgi:hypothetical protein